MKQLVCDNCHKPILNTQVYYRVERVGNGNDVFCDKEKDLCCDCAREITVEKAGDE